MDATQERGDVWAYQLNGGSYFMEVTGCQYKDGRYVLRGATYADTAVIFTKEEKKRLDQGEKVMLVCDGSREDYTLSKSGHTDGEGGYQLTDGERSVNVELVKGQDENKSGWVLCDSFSGTQWKPLLKEQDVLSLEADSSIVVNNYYVYFDHFSNSSAADVQGSHGENKMGSKWTMKQYYEQYLSKIAKQRKQGKWGGDTLARIQVTEKDGSVNLVDCYIP